MDIVRGACSVEKIGGMVFIREDLAPLMLEWKPIDEQEKDRSISIPLNNISALQSTKETSPKMILKVAYKIKLEDSTTEEEEEKSFKLTFTNRPTMNNIKDSLQTIVARSRTRVEGTSTPTPTPQPSMNKESTLTPVPSTAISNASSASSSSALSFHSSQSLSDANLLKNFELQQKLLLEDRQLRDIFTKSVMQFKLSPQIFWSSRLNH